MILFSDTCDDSRQGSSAAVNYNCIPPVWMTFYDTKVFLANVGIQSWGDREEIYRFEVCISFYSFDGLTSSSFILFLALIIMLLVISYLFLLGP